MQTKENNTVKRTLDLSKMPVLSDAQKTLLDALATIPDEQIDYSDAPFLPDAIWTKSAVVIPQSKQQITLRIDAEVLAFFKDTGKQYQSRINAVLRYYVESRKQVKA
jgi:uncharacterized protein (DUF4415 family)